MRIKIKKIIDLQTLLMWVGLLCVVAFALLEHMSIPIPAFSAVKMPLLYVGGVCVIPLLHIPFGNIRKRRYFFIFLVLLALCVFLLVGMKYTSGTVSGFSPERNTIRLVLYLLELFVLMMAFAEKGKSQAVITMVFYCVLLLVVLTDVFMFSGLLTFGTKALPYYFVGTKFSVVYMHFNLFVLWMIQRWKKNGERSVNKWLVCLVAVVVVLVAIYVDCMSGVIGGVFLAWLIVRQKASRKTTKLLTTPMFFVTCIVVCTLIAFVIGFFLELPFVSTFIENVLDRNTTLTGRLKIYQNYAATMESHWLFGYGYGSGNLISVQNFGCTNAQNAVLHWILQCGLIVSTLLITLFALIMKRVNDYLKKTNGPIELLVALVYTYVVLGIVEITYSMAVIMFIGLLFMSANDKTINGLANKEQSIA